MLRTKVITAVAVVAAIASAALTLLPWVDVTRLGLPIRWNGLGIYIGEDSEDYGHLLAGMVNSVPGWIVVVASLAAGGAVLASARVRVLGIIGCGCAFVTAVVCLVYPAVLAGDAKNEMGISLVPDRQVLNSGSLMAEVAATGVLVICTALAAFRRKSVVGEEGEVLEGE